MREAEKKEYISKAILERKDVFELILTTRQRELTTAWLEKDATVESVAEKYSITSDRVERVIRKVYTIFYNYVNGYCGVGDNSLAGLKLSTLEINALKRANIETVKDLRKQTLESLSNVRMLGSKGIEHIVESLRNRGITLK